MLKSLSCRQMRCMMVKPARHEISTGGSRWSLIWIESSMAVWNRRLELADTCLDT
jgi:hypothetical protein